MCHFGSKNAPKPYRQKFFRTHVVAREGNVRILGGCRPVLRILTLFQTKKCHFSHPFSELVFKKLCHHYLGLEQQQQKRFLNWNPFGIRMFVFLSYSFGIETINTSIQTRRSLENHTRFQIKIEPIPVFTPKRLQNHALWGGTYIYGLYKRVYPPPYTAGQKWACLQAGNKLSEQKFPFHCGL